MGYYVAYAPLRYEALQSKYGLGWLFCVECQFQARKDSRYSNILMSINYHFTPLFALCGAPPKALLLPQMGTRHLDHGFGANYLHNIPLTKTLFQIYGLKKSLCTYVKRSLFLLEGDTSAKSLTVYHQSDLFI